MARKTARGSGLTRQGTSYRVVMRDASGRFTRTRPASVTVFQPSRKPVRVRTLQEAARVLSPAPKGMPAGFALLSAKDARRILRQFKGKPIATRTKRAATFQDLTGMALPKGLRKNKQYTVRVTFRGQVYTARGRRDDLLPAILSVLPNFTAAERARLFKGPSGTRPPNRQDHSLPRGFAIPLDPMTRREVLDAAKIPKVGLKLEVFG